MNTMKRTTVNRQLRQGRVRAKVVGTTEQPRLSVHISHQHVTAQIIDDSAAKTLAYASTVGQKKPTGTMTERAAFVGVEIAAKAKSAKVSKVVFDRGSKLYHGRVQALAEAAREKGLVF